jgi:DNA-binding transcriptional LysR family regulator
MINSAPFHPFLPSVIREFGQLYPQVALTLQENSTPALASAVQRDAVDVAFIRPLLAELSDLVIEPLFDEDVVIALPAGHRLMKRKSLPLQALAEERFVLFPRSIGSGLYDEIFEACRRARFSPRISHEVMQVTSIANLVAAGLGVSLVPASMQQVHTSGVAYRPIEGDAPRARMSLAYRRDDDSPAVLNLIKLARTMVDRMGLRRQASR